jgi:hypothetical protein
MKNTCLQLFAIVFTLAFVASTRAGEPSEQTLRYKVDFRGTNAGELETVIERTEDGYLVKSISHPSLLASMFLQNETAETHFQLVDGRLVLQSGREYVTKSGKEVRSFEVDHDAGQIRFSGGDPLDMEPGTRLEADTFPLALMANGLESAAGTKFYAVSGKRARLYQTGEPMAETIEVPAGKFETLRVENRLPGEPSRIYTIWFRVGPQPIPVRVVTGREGKVTTMELLP